MKSEKDLGFLDSHQWKRLHELASRFEEACAAGDGVELDKFLPSEDDPLRSLILLELIKSDLENQWRKGSPRLLDHYCNHYKEIGSRESLPVQLIFEEYWIRKKYGDQPDLESYQERFPQQFARLKQLVQETNRPNLTRGEVAPKGLPMLAKLKEGEILPVGGGYKLIARLGSGNFGQVWKAEAPGGKMVALKILNWPEDHPAAQRERQSLELIKKVNHTYLLDIHAFYSLENSLIIVTRLADGNLSDRLEECKREGSKGIPPAELIRYMEETAEVLDYLHGQGIQHRDIKPPNLLLSQGHIAVGDLGLAKMLEYQQTQASVLGTPPYMAPEVWLKKIHTNTDQYSLAITYVELRRGACPFKNANMEGLQPEHLKERDDLEPLKEAERTTLLKAGHVDPEQRFPSCKDFVEALHAAVIQERPREAIYKKIKRIGKGAFGEVWRGEAPGGIPVAIKLITLNNDDKSKSETEALELIKGLTHPYLVKIFACWLEESELNMAMELAERSLTDRLNQCRKVGMKGIPRAELLAYMKQAAEGLDYLHSHQVLHRDIKPENILLQGKYAKIADFGVAKLIQDRHLFTATTSGTMSYMPPEAWRGKYSVHSDQYSLAATYVEMRLGHRLFNVDNPADAMEAHLTRQPLLSPLPPSEQKVLQKALSKSPEERYETCSEFVEELEKAAQLSPETISAVENGGTIIPGEYFCAESNQKTDIEGFTPLQPKPAVRPPSKEGWRVSPTPTAVEVEVPKKEPVVAPRKKPAPRKVRSKLALTLLILVPLLTLVVGIIAILNFGGVGETRIPVEIESRPPGATIFLNGEKQEGKTNGKFLLAPGKYKLRLEKADYHPIEEEIQIPSRNGSPAFFYDLAPLQASKNGKAKPLFVEIQSQPGSAKVFINDKLQDKTSNNKFELPPGSYEVKLVLDDKHYTFRKQVQVPQVQKLSHTFEPIFLTVNSTPPGAQVFLNNELQGQFTPAKFPVSVGKVEIRVNKEGFYPSQAKTIIVSADEKLQPVEFQLMEMAEVKHALLVGVRHPCLDLPDFLHAEPDMEELGRTLIAGGFDKKKVNVLTQSRADAGEGPQPTRANILAALSQMAEKCTEKDTLVLALAGHQIQFDGGPKGTYFCSADSLLVNPNTLLPLQEVNRLLEECKAKTKLVLLDGWQHTWQKQPPQPPVGLVLKRQGNEVPGKCHVFYSCGTKEESFDHRLLQHGVFFHFVCRGLQGEADEAPGGNNDGNITLKELAEYIQPAITDYVSNHYQKNQKPEAKFSPNGGETTLVKLSPGLKLFNEGTQLVAKKKLQDAIKTLDEAQKLIPEFAELYVQRARAHFALDNLPDVLKDCQLALKYDPNYATAYGFQAEAYAVQKQFKAALDNHAKAIELEPTYAWGYYSRARTFKDMKQENKAILDYERAINFHTELKELYRGLGMTYVQTKDYQKALQAFNRALEIDPQWTELKKIRDQVKKLLDG